MIAVKDSAIVSVKIGEKLYSQPRTTSIGQYRVKEYRVKVGKVKEASRDKQLIA